MLRDLRYAFRQLPANPASTAVVVLSLALAIGANTAIFSLVNAVLIASLPVKDPSALVSLSWGGNEWPRPLNQSSNGAPQGSGYRLGSYSMGFPFFEQVANDRANFTAVFGFAPLGAGRQNTTIVADGVASRVDGEMVAGDYFTGLGTTPLLGRLLTRMDDRSDGGSAVVSYALWNRGFGGDPGVVGRRITVNGLAFEIVGVTRPEFFGPEPGRSPEIWVPAIDAPSLTPWGFRPPDMPSLMASRTYWWLSMMGRLAPGVDRARAQAAVGAQFQQFVTEALAIPAGSRIMPSLVVLPADRGVDALTQGFARPLVVLMVLVGLVLLIACANVATLLVARATARRREIAIRLSLGASRGRLVRQLLTESLTLAAIGGVLGIVAAAWGTRGLLLLLPEDQRMDVATGMNASVLAFTVIITIATAILFGLAPALRATRADVAADIKPSTGLRGAPGSRKDLGSGFVVAQVALSLILVFGAGLFVRTLTELRNEKLGVDPRNVLIVGIDATQNGYSGDRLAGLYQTILDRLRAIPGVANATATRLPLFAGWVSNGPITIQGMESKPEGMTVNYNGVAASFDETMGLRILSGRAIDAADVRGGRRIAVINEVAAAYFFGAANPIGRQFNFGRADSARLYEIVGVIQNAKYNNVRGPFPRTAYVPFTAMPAMLGGVWLQVRTRTEPAGVLSSVRRVIHELEPGLALANVRTESDQVAEALWQERLLAQLVTAFGMLALALACIGVYGTMSYAVSRRTKEIGVRIAIGAQSSQVLWQEMARAIRLAIIGIVIGLPVAFLASRLVRSQLFGVQAADPASMIVAVLVLAAVTSAAGFVPARRAAAVDPMVALRTE